MSAPSKRQMKSAARLYAVQALFQMEAAGQTVEAVRREFEDFRFGAELDGDELVEGDVDLFRALTDKAVNFQAKIDQMTDRALVAKWPIARIDPTLRAQVLDLLAKVSADNGATLFLVTHDCKAARLLASQVAIILGGLVLETGPVEEVLDPGHPAYSPTR